MLPFQPEEFALTVRIDNRVAAQRVASDEAVELYEVVELMAACRCLYDLATLASRELTTIQDCLALWSSMRDQFSGMCHAWEAEIASYGERNGEEAAGYSTQSTPQHVYSYCQA